MRVQCVGRSTAAYRIPMHSERMYLIELYFGFNNYLTRCDPLKYGDYSEQLNKRPKKAQISSVIKSSMEMGVQTTNLVGCVL